MTEIGDLIFDTNRTLFEVLDSLDVPNVATQLSNVGERLDEVNDQLRQLGIIVDTNKIDFNTQLIAVNTALDNINKEIGDVLAVIVKVNQLSDEVEILSKQIPSISDQLLEVEKQLDYALQQVASITVVVNSFSTRILTLETSNSSLTAIVSRNQQTLNGLYANQARLQILTLGNEYSFVYRSGNPNAVYQLRITFSGDQSVLIRANQGYDATILQDGTQVNRTVYLAAPFDQFLPNYRIHYLLIQGPILLSFESINTSPINGYLTTL